jgi:hypothetical protein
MAELTEGEWDRCEHCGSILRSPPCCCAEAIRRHEAWLLRELSSLGSVPAERFSDEDDWSDGGSDASSAL